MLKYHRGVFNLLNQIISPPPLKALQQPSYCMQNESQTPSGSLQSPVWARTSLLLPSPHLPPAPPCSLPHDPWTYFMFTGHAHPPLTFRSLHWGGPSFEHTFSRFSLIDSFLPLSFNVTSTESQPIPTIKQHLSWSLLHHLVFKNIYLLKD